MGKRRGQGCKHAPTKLVALAKRVLAPEIAEAWLCLTCGETIIRLAPPTGSAKASR